MGSGLKIGKVAIGAARVSGYALALAFVLRNAVFAYVIYRKGKLICDFYLCTCVCREREREIVRDHISAETEDNEHGSLLMAGEDPVFELIGKYSGRQILVVLPLRTLVSPFRRVLSISHFLLWKRFPNAPTLYGSNLAALAASTSPYLPFSIRLPNGPLYFSGRLSTLRDIPSNRRRPPGSTLVCTVMSTMCVRTRSSSSYPSLAC